MFIFYNDIFNLANFFFRLNPTAWLSGYNKHIMSNTFTAIVTEEAGGFVALNPETDVASQGDTIDQALCNLKEALILYSEELNT